MRYSRKDIFSLANGISLTGVGLSLWGAEHIDTYSGIVAFGCGRVLDLVDGPVARRTHSSDFGAGIDAGGDKLVMGALLANLWRKTGVSKAAIAAVASYNLNNVGITLLARERGDELQPALIGKHAMALCGVGLVGNALEDVAHKRGHDRIEYVAHKVGKLTEAGITFGIGSTIGMADAAGIISTNHLPDYFLPRHTEATRSH